MSTVFPELQPNPEIHKEEGEGIAAKGIPKPESLQECMKRLSEKMNTLFSVVTDTQKCMGAVTERIDQMETEIQSKVDRQLRCFEAAMTERLDHMEDSIRIEKDTKIPESSRIGPSVVETPSMSTYYIAKDGDASDDAEPNPPLPSGTDYKHPFTNDGDALDDGDASDDAETKQAEHSGNRNFNPSKVKIENFEGKVYEWDNWFHKFSFMANNCNWTDQEKLFKLTLSLTGNALTAHRNLLPTITNDYEQLCQALKQRYCRHDKATKAVL